MRNNFEHYDSRLEEFARQGGTYIDSNIIGNRLGGLERRKNRMTDQGLFQRCEHRHPLFA